MLARVAAWAAPSATHDAGEPVSVMVRAGPTLKAPGLCCLHVLQGLVSVLPQPVVNEAQSESAVHGVGGFLHVAVAALPQKGQKTSVWAVRSTDVWLAVPVVSAKGIGSEPMNCELGGGQSWLVG